MAKRSIIRNAWFRLGGLLLCAGAPSLAATDPAGLEFFEKQIRPLLVEHCYQCHSADSKNLKGGLRLDFRDGLLKGGDSGPALVPGQPEASRLVEAVRYHNRDLQMPPKTPLSPSQVEALVRWVALGAPDPREATGPVAAAPGKLGLSLEEGREFWAFQPVAPPEVPEVRAKALPVRTPVDAFLFSRLEQEGLRPAPRADKRTLIRRATFDLTGLPPTAEEVEAFLADRSDHAFDQVIDRLLESPQYGVRWGRHWLDVARYADSNGLDENLTHGHAWRYRDYVVDSFNQDKPFDRFLIEQIAGDLLPDADPETKTATGFLALGAKVLAEGDDDKLMMDIIDEQMDTMGKAFMGLTLGCARCHDHKFDPISQEDYYGLAAIFKSTQTLSGDGRGAIKYWYEHSFATEEETERVKAVEKEIAGLKSAAASYKSKATASLRAAAREQAAVYLEAAARFTPEATLEEVAAIADPLGLHPRILHHCRLHLDYHRTDPLFKEWHARADKPDSVRQYFEALFQEADAAWAAARKADPKVAKLEDERLERARVAMNDASGFLAVPAKPAHAFDADTLAEYERLEEKARVFESRAIDLTAAMGVTDGEILASLPVHIRGSHLNLGKPVPRGVPEVMHLAGRDFDPPKERSGRLQLARWMVDPAHPLTARVLVNRVWGWHFGRGLVGTTENFGLLGDRPSHPDLLDWLAARLVESGWSLKNLHRMIMKSHAYQMSSAHPEEALLTERDPGNRWWARFEIQRLDAEQIRDAILNTAGLLDLSLGGKTIPLRNRQFVFNHTSEDHTQYDQLHRRALYLPVVRNHLCEMFQQFDYPDPSIPTGHRQATVVAPQALWLMNSPLALDAADALAGILLREGGTDSSRVDLAYRRVFQRVPSSAERNRALAFLREARGPQPLLNAATVDEPAFLQDQVRAWSLFCQSLLASNEFFYLN